MSKNLKMILFLSIISSISVTILSIGNKYYLNTALDPDKVIYKLVLDKFIIKYSLTNIEEVFLENFEIIETSPNKIYISKKYNKGSIIIKNEGSGLWSIIELLIFVSPNRETLLGLNVLSHGETPGLGSLIEEEEFLQQFNGVYIRPKLDEIDGVTGATITSTAVEKIINEAISIIDERVQ